MVFSNVWCLSCSLLFWLIQSLASSQPEKKILYFEWSPPWHFKTATLDLMSAWSCQVRVDIQLISWNASGYSQLHRLTGGNLLTFFLTYFLTFFLTYLLTFFLSFFLTFCLTPLLTLFMTFFLAYLLTFFLAVEVRQGTLSADGRGWGPAGNTRRRWSRSLQCMSGREHWTWRLAVEGWQHDDEEGRKDEKGGGRRKEATDIKSNNPHLTGGDNVLTRAQRYSYRYPILFWIFYPFGKLT